MMRIGLRWWTLGLVAWAGCSGPPDVDPGPQGPAPPPLPPLTSPAKRPAGTVAERVARADEQAGRGELAAAIETLDEAMLIDANDRQVLARLVRYSKDRSAEVVATDPADAYRRIVTAGEYLRMLQKAHPESTDEEKDLARDVLYAEASAHARSLRLEETEGTLRELVGAGFRDFDRIDNDPDWAAMRALDQFQPFYKELKEQAKAP